MKSVVMMGDGQMEKEPIREGDYLRMKLNVDDDKEERIWGCIPLPSSSNNKDVVCHSKSTDSVASLKSRSKFTKKMLQIFRSSRSEQSMASTRHPSGGTPPRRYMRVVTDRHAPPPDKPNDNPNTIPHYSQGFLKQYYASKTWEDRNNLPYIVADNSILKKSSTDPTNNRGALISHTAVIEQSQKHATFSDVVTVFNCLEQTVTKQRLQSSDDSDTECSAGENRFFLESNDPQPANDTASDSEPDKRAVQDDTDEPDGFSTGETRPKVESQAMLNIFSSIITSPYALGVSRGTDVPLLPLTRQVDLKTCIDEQSRTSDCRESL